MGMPRRRSVLSQVGWLTPWYIAIGSAVLTVIVLLRTVPAESTSKLRVAVPSQVTTQPAFADAYDRYMKAYAAARDDLFFNFKLQGLALILALVMIRSRLDKVSIKGANVEISARALQLLVPAVLLYLWLAFGFHLHTTIQQRILLWDMIGAKESAVDLSQYQISARQLLRDQFFLDQYFLAFRKEQAGIEEAGFYLLNRCIFTGFGIFLGAVHAAIFATIINIYAEQKAAAPYKDFRKLLIVYAVGCAIFITTSHVHFYSQNPNTLQYVILTAFILIVPLMASWRGADAAK